MFNIGDYVVNANNGVCLITEIVEMDLSGGSDVKPYFLLVPVEENSARVFIPVDKSDSRIRRVLTGEEAMEVIDQIPQIGETVIRNEKEREARYKEAVRSCDPVKLFSVLKTLYRRKMERLAQGKKSTAVDDRYCKMAENHLYAELAFALDRQKDEMEELIKERLDAIAI